MATAQTLPLTSESSTHFGDLYPLPSQRGQYRSTMGSVGSLIEKPNLSPEPLHSSRAVPQAGPRQPDGLLKKGLAQRELLNYLNITKKEPKPGKRTVSSIKREHGSEEGENLYSKMHHKHDKEIDLTKNSLPLEKERGSVGSRGGRSTATALSCRSMATLHRLHGCDGEAPPPYQDSLSMEDMSQCRPSAFKPVTPKNFSSMQNLYPSRHEDPEKGLPNGLHHVSYTKASPSRSGPTRPPPPRTLSQQDEENMSDSGHHSLNSLPPYRPHFKAHLGQISASMSHINHIGSLERGSVGSRGGRSTATALSCRSMATLHRLHGCDGKKKKSMASQCRPSAFKPVTPKNFSSMQNLYPSRHEDPEKGLPNGLHHVSYTKASPSRSGPTRPPPPRTLSQQDEENMSDSGHHSLNSLPPYRPPFKAHLGQISASMSHINHIGSLERGSVGSRGGRSTATALSCRSMATLHRLHGCDGEAPPPYQDSLSMEDMVKDLGERLLEKEHELKHVRRNLDESEDAIAQVFEERQRLWEKEIEELKRLYATKLRQISQQAQRSQRTLQLQLYKVQQEKRRLQEDLGVLQRECEGLKTVEQGQDNPRLEETKWEVCQKSGEISLLKQQLRDSQAEVAQKLGDIFSLKTQLRETRGELRSKDNEIELLRDSLRRTLQDREEDGEAEETTEQLRETRGELQSKDNEIELLRDSLRRTLQDGEEDGEAEGEGREGRGQQQGSTEERLRAELLLERRQNEAQTSLFESERRTWQNEKEKVIRYQKELQTGYLEMYHKNQALEKELQELRGAGGGGGESGSSSTGASDPQQPTGLPWIERIESSEI
ncbi:UNVERIFIED_CONTAM: hypothetical protein FKN15_072543 [Acipenser sinensis]